MINTYDFFGRNGQVLSIVDGTLSWIDPPKCYCDDGQTQRKKSYNCPNCGAPITGPRCEYCGTWFEDMRPSYYTMKIPYPQRQSDIESQARNLQTQINEVNTQIAISAQTQSILHSLQSWSMELYIPRPASLGTVKTR